ASAWKRTARYRIPVLVRMRAVRFHALAIHACPLKALRADAGRCPGIVEGQDLAIAVTGEAALLGADLAESDPVPGAVSLKQDSIAAVNGVVEVTADRVPSQRAADGELEIRSADAACACAEFAGASRARPAEDR